MKILFFESDKIWKKDIYKKNLANHELIFLDETIQNANLKKHSDADVLVCFVFSKVKQQYLSLFDDLKMVACESTGFDHVDVDYCKENDIIVCTVPDYGERTVAEFSLGLMLCLSRKIPQAVMKTKKGNFSREGLRGNDLDDKTAGVIGTGSIGRNMIRLCNGMDMNVLAYDAYPKKDYQISMNFRYVSLQTIFEESDYITLHVPLLESTHHLLGRKEFASMKKKPYVINTSRGGVIDTLALREALEEGHIRGAALDVFEGEDDFEVGSESDDELNKAIRDLIGDEKVIITPHLAFNSEEAVKRIYLSTVESIKQLFREEEVINAIH